jgi:hypothetical protein
MKVTMECLKDYNSYDTAFLIIACMAVAECAFSLIPNLVNTLYETVLCSVPVTVENACLLNEMLKMWIVVFDKIKMDKEEGDTAVRMASSPNLYALLGNIYNLEAREGTLVCFTSGLEELNFLKYEAAECSNRSIQCTRRCCSDRRTSKQTPTMPCSNSPEASPGKWPKRS